MLTAVILDWAGTVLDYGCRAPVVAFDAALREFGVALTEAQIRAPMGTAKQDHIRALLGTADGDRQWRQEHGRVWSEADVLAIYARFEPLELASVASYADLIPGALEAIGDCRERGLRIGSCTGYNHAIMAPILPAAARQGYAPDCLVCPEDVGGGRPHPWMIFENMRRLAVYPPSSIVKVGDTIADIAEGRNAGVWSVGVTRSGNELGLSQAEADALGEAELALRTAAIERRMRAAGAHAVIASIADLPQTLDALEARVARGEHP